MFKSSAVFKPSALALALGLSLAPVMWSGNSHAAPPAKKSSSASQQPITLNFVNADIESVARTLATVHNRNLVVDPRVKGTINLSTEQAVSPAEAWEQFSAVLRLQGFAVVETNRLYKIVPEADAKLLASPVAAPDNARANAGEQVITQVFRLKHETAANLVPVLRPLIAPNNTVMAYPGNNSLVITDPLGKKAGDEWVQNNGGQATMGDIRYRLEKGYTTPLERVFRGE